MHTKLFQLNVHKTRRRLIENMHNALQMDQNLYQGAFDPSLLDVRIHNLGYVFYLIIWVTT